MLFQPSYTQIHTHYDDEWLYDRTSLILDGSEVRGNFVMRDCEIMYSLYHKCIRCALWCFGVNRNDEILLIGSVFFHPINNLLHLIKKTTTTTTITTYQQCTSFLAVLNLVVISYTVPARPAPPPL